ncbi:MAG TPA: DMT family transporter [Leucothrix sp.]|nr:DMT family transporter [Leucothrix sp.]
MIRYIPFIFVLLWSTGFVGAKFGLPYAEPFTLLMWRMVIVVPLFLLLIVIFKRPKISLFDASIQGLVGLLIHGFYLGGVFAAIAVNIPAGLSALFVSLNPIVIAIFSGVVLNTSISKREWSGLLLGLLGVIIVLYGASNWEGVITTEGIAWLNFSLMGIVAGTLIQKRYAQNVDLITGSSYQYAAALLFFATLSFSMETGKVDWSFEFMLTLSWLVIVLSLISILILLYMIRHGEATKVASYFYLTPPLAAFWGWLFFDEQWSWITLTGASLVIGALVLIKPMKKQ